MSVNLRNSIDAFACSCGEKRERERAIMGGKKAGIKSKNSRHHSSCFYAAPKALLRTEWSECTCYAIFTIVLTCCTLSYDCIASVECICVNLSLFIVVDDPKENNEKKTVLDVTEMMHIYATMNLLGKLNCRKLFFFYFAFAFVYTSNNRRGLMKLYVYGDWS